MPRVTAVWSRRTYRNECQG